MKTEEDVSTNPPPKEQDAGLEDEAKQVGVVEGDENEEPTTVSVSSGSAAAATMAMTNPLIINHLFKLCPAELKLLANCRLVSKQWYQESLLTWRNSSIITVCEDRDGDSDDDDDDDEEEEDAEDLGLFLATLEWGSDEYLIEKAHHHIPFDEFLAYCDKPQNQCIQKPYRSFRLVWLESKWEQMRAFWNTWGSALTTLHLVSCTFKTVDHFLNIIFTACPNLQTLNVDECFFPKQGKAKAKASEQLEMEEFQEPLYGKHDHLTSLQITSFLHDPNPLPISWLELFSHFQSLTHFSFKLDRGEFPAFKQTSIFDCLKNAIRTVRNHDPKALPFKRFQLQPLLEIYERDPVSQEWIEIIQELRLPLDSVIMKVMSGKDRDYLKTVLQECSGFLGKTIREITLIKHKSSIVMEPPFPFGIQLDALTTLKIKGNLCVTLAFLRYTPNLEVLEITGEDTKQTNMISKRCFKEMKDVRMGRLVRLKLECLVTDQGLYSLFKWMPRLRSLEMGLNDKQLGDVCKKWRRLTSLTVSGHRLTLASVTGVEDLGGGNGAVGNLRKCGIAEQRNFAE